MGRIRRGGYTVVWWAGDHPPRHVHVYDGKDRFLGRVTVETQKPLDDWIPPPKVIEIVKALRNEGRL